MTTTVPARTGPSLLPDSFKTEKDQLLGMPCERVVEYLMKDEARRNENTTPDSEKEVRVEYRSTLLEVETGIACLSELKNRGKFLIVKCLSVKGVYLLQDLPGLIQINEQYREFIKMAGKYGGLSSVKEMAEVSQYHPVSREGSGRGEFRMAKKLKSAYNRLTDGMGMGVSYLVAIGLGMVLADTEEPDLRGVADDLQAEVEAFRIYVRDRAILMDAYHKVAVAHLRDAGKM